MVAKVTENLFIGLKHFELSLNKGLALVMTEAHVFPTRSPTLQSLSGAIGQDRKAKVLSTMNEIGQIEKMAGNYPKRLGSSSSCFFSATFRLSPL